MSNNLSDDDPRFITCDLNYDVSIEFLKYVVQAVYLFGAAILHIFILRTILWKRPDEFRNNSFYSLYAADSIVSLTMLLLDGFINRPFIFIPPLCPIFAPILAYPTLFWKSVVVIGNYMKAAKSMTQIFMSLNRMTCALWPLKYITIWENRVKYALLIIFIAPIGAIFNLVVSRIIIASIYGGFSNTYIRKISWASLPFQHLVFILTALSFTIICTSIAIYALLMLPNRVKGAERSLCIANIIFSIGFICAAGAQAAIVFCTACLSNLLFMIHFWCIDFLNVSSPIVMLIVGRDLRRKVFELGVTKLVTYSEMAIMSANFSEDGPNFITCDLSFDTTIEVFKYLVQAIYLFGAAILHILILRTILWKRREEFKNNSFYSLYVADSIVSLTMLLLDGFINRPFIFIPPLCPIFAPILAYPTFFWKSVMVIGNYMKAAKSMTQIFMSLNRMTCALWPLKYITIWENRVKYALVIIFIAPIGAIFNLVVSRILIGSIYGGFSNNYIRKISWANLPFQHLVFITIAIFFTVICTSIAIYALLMLPNRVKGAERSLCIVNIIFSVGFCCAASSQAAIVFCTPCLGHLLFMIHFWCIDFLNVSSPLLMIICNLMTYDSQIEILKYILQFSYLFPGAILIIYMLFVITIKCRASYLDNCYHWIFVFELVTSLYLIIHDILFGRLTIYISPLCPILAPYFYNYSFLLKFSMVSINYVRASKSVSQIFLTLNRMTCVLFPVHHQKHWGNSMKIVMIVNICLPFGAIWSLMLSRVYASANYGGFSSNYVRAVEWASLSRLQSIYLTISLIFAISTSFATFYGLTTLSKRIKHIETTLCVVTFFSTTAFLFAAIIQYIWVFCTACSREYPSIYGVQFLSYDVLTIGTPIVMIIVNEKLRLDMFPWIFRKSLRISIVGQSSGSRK
ncbi:unnamed protein product [Caenorhabditis angaria]|uniref:Serpentine receptor class gamma n=1 Tax=Caenorhabditis angaria TaxID=860376 RepID=A0A9P1IFP1_9PELO|nr:unnamed protein product [Caenorhabditis angaria]